MKIAVVGMGLIGGSLCRAFHHYTPHKVLGTTRNHKTVEFALSVGAIDEERLLPCRLRLPWTI